MIGVHNINDPNDIVLVRIYGDKTDLFINRKEELRNFKVSFAWIVSGKFIGTGGVMGKWRGKLMFRHFSSGERFGENIEVL